jgi:N-acetylmuramoyl-L-alanine amidase
VPKFKKRSETDFIAVHCSATPPTMDIGAAEIRRWHKAKGWMDIGYHFVIRRDGALEIGRDEAVHGAHVEGFNHNSVGICLIGGTDSAEKPEANFTAHQMAALFHLVARLQVKYPTAVLQGHRDFPNVKKDCPSFDVKQWWHSMMSVEVTTE